ncbi:MAG: OmpH family outer membrane protein [Bacteroidales bacterium]|nr:OmpH family outer membrane protein [Bacteroidales bacterium]
MKKILLIAAMALVSATGFAQNKFAYVNFTELVQLMPEMDEVRTKINAIQKEAGETYQGMETTFNKLYQEYEAQSKVGWSSQTIREDKEKELTQIQQRMQDYIQNFQAELQQSQQELMVPVYNKAQETVNKIAKDGGYTIIFDRGTVLYISETQCTDITVAARKALSIPEGRTLETLQAELQAQAQAEAAK